uniref:Pentacotripeptide-repeat region of PRORP domain-containing protein n=1 Tax=Rhodosorus marinus TaxID=101924 RepID=A0A7S2ZK04_9RHOD|mmetsp:Transcript_22162/g.89722  ORF Transcript_22162/g.89722 Transcript_22162/m.89722 type:complete len:1248 (+) Transcript_22162:360-4103(+)
MLRFSRPAFRLVPSRRHASGLTTREVQKVFEQEGSKGVEAPFRSVLDRTSAELYPDALRICTKLAFEKHGPGATVQLVEYAITLGHFGNGEFAFQNLLRTFLNSQTEPVHLRRACELVARRKDLVISDQLTSLQIQCFARSGLVNKSLDILNENRDLVLDASTLESVLLALSAEGTAEDVQRLKKILLETNSERGPVFFKSFIHAHGRAGQPNEAKVLLDEMKKRGLNPGIEEYNAIVRAYAELGDMEAIEETLSSMKVAKMEPSSQTYYIYMSALLMRGEVEEVERLYTKMVFSGVKMDLGIMKVVSKAKFNAGRDSEVPELLTSFLKALPGSIDSELAGILVEGFAENRQFEEAWKLVFEAQLQKIPLAEKSVDELARYLALSGDVEGTERALKLLTQPSIHFPTEDTLTSLAIAYVRANSPARALRHISTGKRRGFRRVGFIQIALEAYARELKAAEAVTMLAQVKKLRTPTALEYGLVLRSLTENGLGEEAVKLLKDPQLQGREFLESIKVSNEAKDVLELAAGQLISLLTSRKNRTGLSEVLDFVRSKNLSLVDEANKSLVRHHVEGGNLLDAVSTLESLQSVESDLCHLVLEALSIAGDLTGFQKCALLLKGTGVHWEERTFALLIDLFSRNGDPISAHNTFHSLVKTIPSAVRGRTGNSSLLRAFSVAGMEREALLQLKRMRKERIVPEVGGYEALVQMYNRQGQRLRAKKIIELMLDDGFVPNPSTVDAFIIAGNVERHASEAKAAFADLKSLKLVARLTTYNALLDTFARNAMVEEARSALALLEAVGLKPNSTTYRHVIDACINAQDRSSLRSLSKELRESKAATAMILQAMTRVEDHVGAADEVDARGIPTDQQTIERAFCSCVRAKRVETAVRILKTFVQEQGIFGNGTHQRLVRAVAESRGSLRVALRSISSKGIRVRQLRVSTSSDDMEKQASRSVNADSYQTPPSSSGGMEADTKMSVEQRMREHWDRKEYSDVVKVFQAIQGSKGRRLGRDSLRMLLESIIKVGTDDEACAAIEQGHLRGLRFTAEAYRRLVTIRSAAGEGDAMAIVEEDSTFLNSRTFLEVLRNFLNRGMPSSAVHLFEVVNRNKVIGSESLNEGCRKLIEYSLQHGDEHDAERSLKILAENRNADVEESTLLPLLRQSTDIEDVVRLQELVSHQTGDHAQSYSLLIRSLAEDGNVQAAGALLEKQGKAGIKSDRAAVIALRDAYRKHGEYRRSAVLEGRILQDQMADLN